MTDRDEKMKKLGIPKGADVQFIDMGPGKVDRRTAGWTDEQIEAKTLDQLDQQLDSARRTLQIQRDAVRDQENRVLDMERIRQRKVELSGPV